MAQKHKPRQEWRNQAKCTSLCIILCFGGNINVFMLHHF